VAGGRSAPLPGPVVALTLYFRVYERLYPDDWISVCICAVLLCLPAPLMYFGADYLAEVPFVVFPLKPTPEVIWRVLAYVWAASAAMVSVFRLVG